MPASVILRNGTSRIGPGYVVLMTGLTGTIVDQDWCQAYIVAPGGSAGSNTIRHGNTITHGASSAYIVIGAREKVSAPTQPWHFQLHSDLEDEGAADGVSVSLICEHYSPSAGLVDTVTTTTLVFDKLGFPETSFAAIERFTAENGMLGLILASVRRTYTS